MSHRPLVTRTTHSLPFDRLSPLDFERLCLWLARREGYAQAEHLGASGGEEGRDIVALRDGRRIVFQCKRVARFGPRDAEAEIAKIRSLPKEERPDELLFLTTCGVSALTRKRARKAWGDRGSCRFLSGSELDERVRRHPEVVEQFFDLGVPVPTFFDQRSRSLGESLEQAYGRLERLAGAGEDSAAARQEILELRRQIREGGQLRPGDFVADGRYHLLELLGQGGFGTVFKAFDRRRHELVAIKVLDPRNAGDRTRLERFGRGARQMAKLEHPGIVRVLEPTLEDGGYHFFVMEYLEDDLRQAILEQKLSAQSGLEAVLEVAEALGFAHERGVVHRDVKPANILLAADGRAKLTDFDLVLAAAETTGGTRTGSVIGTFLYMAPEMIGLSKGAGPTADVYSLAMTAAFVLLGREIPSTVLKDRISFFEGLEANDAIYEALVKATAWDEARRFASVGEFAEALAGGLSGGVYREAWRGALEDEVRRDLDLAVRSAFDLEELFDEALLRAVSLLSARRGALYILGDDRYRLMSRFGGEAAPECGQEEIELIRGGAVDPQTIFPGSSHLILEPIEVEDAPRGFLALADKESRSGVGPFPATDHRKLAIVASRLGLALERAQLERTVQEHERLARELELAAVIQQRLLPSSLPEIPGYEVIAWNRPARQVGGDYYDFQKLEDGSWCLVVADVLGRGLTASLLISNLHSALRLLVELVDFGPPLVERLNRHIFELSPPNRFVTLIVAALEAATGRLRYLNAGHNPGLLVRTGGEVEHLPSAGLPVGLMEQGSFGLGSVELLPGDLVCLYTDGITECEAPDEREFGLERLVDLLSRERARPLEEILERIDSALGEFSRGLAQGDDQTAVLLRHR